MRIRETPPFYRAWWFLTIVAIGVTGLAALSYRSRIAQLKRAQVAQQAFSRRLIESQESERQRIASELHDSLGQNLLVIKNRAMLGILNQPNEQAQAQFEEISTAASQTPEEVRVISSICARLTSTSWACARVWRRCWTDSLRVVPSA